MGDGVGSNLHMFRCAVINLNRHHDSTKWSERKFHQGIYGLVIDLNNKP